MTNIALIFPGQGSQKVGMGKEFYEFSPAARAVFDEAVALFNSELKHVMFEGPAEKLTSTAFCQPGILTMSIAALTAFQAHPKFKNLTPRFAAGLSLGEYAALVAAGAFSFRDALKLVERRSFFMEEATKLQSGAMAAIIGFDKKRLTEICAQAGAQVANFNSPEQIVITGHSAKVKEACQLIQAEGAKTVIPLEVSGAFHSTLMQTAADQFQAELKKISVHPTQIPVISNVHAQPQSQPDEILSNLAKQITSPVQWEDSVKYMAQQGIKEFIEIGPGKVLRGLIRRIDVNLKVFNIEKPEDIEVVPF